MSLREYQSEAVNLLRQSLGKGYRHPLLQLPTGGGKCLGHGTPVLMFDGSVKPVEKIKSGDLLMGPDSKPKKVLSTCSGSEELYEIMPIKGDSYVVNKSHILSLRMTNFTGSLKVPNGEKVKKGEIVNISVSDYLESSQTFKHCAKGWRAGVDFEDKKSALPVPAYIMGAWIGDGTTNLTEITTADFEVEKEWREYASAMGCNVVSREGRNCNRLRLVTKRGKGNPALSAFRSAGVFGDKKITIEYMTASRFDRLEFLAGIIDTDGYLHHGHIEIVQKKKGVIKGIAFIARSLGFAAYYKKTTKGIASTEFSNEYYRLTISGDLSEVPCRVKRKTATERKQKKNVLNVGIKVRSIGFGNYYGFELDGDGLFMLGDFTVTHNTHIAISIIRSALDKNKKILFLAPRRELIYQVCEKLRDEGISHGMIMSGEPRYLFANVQVASMDTLHARGVRNEVMELPDADLILVDEAHLSVAPTRKEILSRYPDAVIIGLTATPARGDGKGLGEIYDDLVLSWPIRKLTEHGFLVPVKYFAPSKPDLEGLKLNRDKDYVLKELEGRVDNAQLIGDVVYNWFRLASDKKTVVFCVTRAHSRHVCEEFVSRGIRAEHLDGDTPLDQRKAILERVRTGETQVLCNVFVATYGLDIPSLECAVLARPTRNIALYLQTVGRVLRPSELKTEAIVIDHAGAIDEHGFVDDFIPWSLDSKTSVKERKDQMKKERQEPKEITCGDCGTVFKSSRVCPGCGHESIPPGKPIPTHQADLQEVKRETSKNNRDMTWEEKASFYGQLKQYCINTKKNPGWAAHKYKEKFGVWPNDKRVKDAPRCEISDVVKNWIRSRNIAYAKRRVA